MRQRIVLAVLGFVLGVAVLEGGARLAEFALAPASDREGLSGWQATFFADLFDWHERDAELLWRFRANLDNPLIKTNQDHLIGEELRPKSSGAFRIVVLGDSSPVGLGLFSRFQTFAALLPDELTAIGRPVEVVNAAVTGYTSEQIRRFLELSGDRLEADAFVLYCGNNDASVSGTRSDQELLEEQRLTGIRRLMSHLSLYRMLRAAVSCIREERIGSESLVVRVPVERYEQNLRAIANYCKESDAHLYVCEPPAPLLWPAGLQFRIFRHFVDEDGEMLLPQRMREILGRDIHYCISPARFSVLYGDADRITRAVYASAPRDTLYPGLYREQLAQQLRTHTGDAIAWNNLGVQYWSDGQMDSAGLCLTRARSEYVTAHRGDSGVDVAAAGSTMLFNLGIVALSSGPNSLTTVVSESSSAFVWLDSALQADYFSLRIKREYVDRIERVARFGHVTRIHLPSVFARNGGETLFVDHCHPTAVGHRLIARVLATEILAHETGKRKSL